MITQLACSPNFLCLSIKLRRFSPEATIMIIVALTAFLDYCKCRVGFTIDLIKHERSDLTQTPYAVLMCCVFVFVLEKSAARSF